MSFSTTFPVLPTPLGNKRENEEKNKKGKRRGKRQPKRNETKINKGTKEEKRTIMSSPWASRASSECD